MLAIFEVRTRSNRRPNLVEQDLRFWFVVFHEMCCQVQLRFGVLSMRRENRTEPNFGNPRPRSAEAAAVGSDVLAESISENDPASPSYQAGLCDDMIRNDGRSTITVTGFTSSILAPHQPLMSSSGEVESIFTKELSVA